MECIILCRVSSREQEIDGYSLPAQEKFLKEYTEREGLSVKKVFSISESASGKKQRQLFNEMIAYVKKNSIKIIVCEKVDRFTRNFKDMVAIDAWLEEDAERQIRFVKNSLILHKNSRSQEKLNWGMQVLISKNYIDNLSEEVKKGQKEKIEQGWLSSRPPVGYVTTGEKGHKTHIIDPKKAPLVKEILE
jgi:DNA invertase Pin-like site-specific DNA recombinase